MMDYNELVVTTRSQPGQITTNTTVFGPTSGKGGQINPFYQAPAGSPGSTASEQVSWVDLMGRGDGTDFGRSVLNEEAWYGQASLTYKISDRWQAQLTDALGVDHYDDRASTPSAVPAPSWRSTAPPRPVAAPPRPMSRAPMSSR